jgi:carbonic anhydrase/acetyltransferase-like protein (isoleucine patch superfamily)
MNGKYRLTRKTLVHEGRTLRRVKYRDAIPILDGILGGWIESEENLSQEGGCRVLGDAKVYGDARIFENANVGGSAEIGGKSAVYGNARVDENAKIDGDAEVRIYGNAHVYGHSNVSSFRTANYGCGPTHWSHNPSIFGNARIFGRAKVRGDVKIYGDAQVYGCANLDACNGQLTQYVGEDGKSGWESVAVKVHGTAQVFGNAELTGNAELSGSEKISSVNDSSPKRSAWSVKRGRSVSAAKPPT